MTRTDDRQAARRVRFRGWSGTVLLVDEPTVARHRLAAELQSQGRRVLAADSAEHALYVLLRHAVDVVVSAVDLRGMACAELVGELQARGGPPVVLVGGPTSGRHRAALLEAGATDVVEQGAPPATIAARCSAVLRRRLVG